jgi:hypothetical protein
MDSETLLNLASDWGAAALGRLLAFPVIEDRKLSDSAGISYTHTTNHA